MTLFLLVLPNKDAIRFFVGVCIIVLGLDCSLGIISMWKGSVGQFFSSELSSPSPRGWVLL